MTNPYYPSQQKTGALHDDFRLLFDHMYEQQQRNEQLESRLKDLSSKHAALSEKVANGPSTTKIAGLYVRGTPPADGQTLKYSKATGDISWQNP